MQTFGGRVLLGVLAILLAAVFALGGCASRPRVAPGLYDVVWSCATDRRCTSTMLQIDRVHRGGWADARACARIPNGRVSCAAQPTATINLGRALWIERRSAAIDGAPPVSELKP